MTKYQKLLYREFRRSCGKGIRVVVPFLNNNVIPDYPKRLQKLELDSRNSNGIVVK